LCPYTRLRLRAAKRTEPGAGSSAIRLQSAEKPLIKEKWRRSHEQHERVRPECRGRTIPCSRLTGRSWSRVTACRAGVSRGSLPAIGHYLGRQLDYGVSRPGNVLW